MKELTQEVFNDQPADVTFACVDFDGLLKFGKNLVTPRYTYASERWRGFDTTSTVENSGYQPLTSIHRAPLGDEMVEIIPVGQFILDHTTKNKGRVVLLEDGAYYHYSDVCSMLKAYRAEKK